MQSRNPGDETDIEALFRSLPQVDRTLRLPQLEALVGQHPRAALLDAVRRTLDRLRAEVLAGALDAEGLALRCAPASLAEEVARSIAKRGPTAYRRAVNATGVVLHTGLGRAVLSPRALRAVEESLAGYSIVEVDPLSGDRSRREAALIELFRELTGAESGTVVNNNAAATLLILAGLARGREVVISRGQLVEIGGSFRVPEILRESGATLVEVGTTNRTYVEDYRRAIGPATGLILEVHPSNFRVVGFTHSASSEELAALAREHALPFVSDLGSGALIEVAPEGVEAEPLASAKLASGADLVCFSGDKLLGGPQAGIILGRRDLVERLRAHPLFRALRVDKLTLVALEATLSAYLDPEGPWGKLPAIDAILEPRESVRKRAEALRDSLQTEVPRLQVRVVPSAAQAGSGSLPAQDIASFAVALVDPERSAEELAAALRRGEPPIFARIREGEVLLDLRTILRGDETLVLAALRHIESTSAEDGA